MYSSQNPLFTCYTICLIQYFLFFALYLKKTTEELEKELESILRKGSPNIWLGGVRFVLVFFWFLKNFFVGVVLVVFFFFTSTDIPSFQSSEDIRQGRVVLAVLKPCFQFSGWCTQVWPGPQSWVCPNTLPGGGGRCQERNSSFFLLLMYFCYLSDC